MKKLFIVITFIIGCNSSPPSLLSPSAKRKVKIKGKVSFTEKKIPPAEIFQDFNQRIVISRNPFLKMEEETTEEGESIILNYHLSGIVFSPRDRYAILEGRIVRENDIIDNFRVARINPEDIVLEDAEGTKYVVKLETIAH